MSIALATIKIATYSVASSTFALHRLGSCLASKVNNTAGMANDSLISVDFEVHGRVQGVFFRKYTKNKADELGLVGWCMNTNHGTVRGSMQGRRDSVEAMKRWLQVTGSPRSKIEKAEFSAETPIQCATYTGFDIRR